MPLPYSRNTVYAAGSQVKSADLNKLQDLFGQLFGRQGLLLYDDFARFDGAAANFHDGTTRMEFLQQTALTSMAPQYNEIAPNSTNKIKGALRLSSSANSANWKAQGARLYIGTGDYWISFRLSVIDKTKLAADAVAGGGLSIGILPQGGSPASNLTGLRVVSDEATWVFQLNGVRTEQVNTSADYLTFHFVRLAGKVTVVVGSTTVINDVTNTDDLVDVAPYIEANSASNSGAADLVALDRFSIWVP